MPTKDKSGPRCAAIVGPYLSGKTSLLESILFAAGAVNRKGTIKEGNTVSDSSPEAQKRQMSVELSVANVDYLDDQWAFIDCPGSIELSQEAMNALMVVDVAIVVCEPDATKALAVSPLLIFLESNAIPHVIFINKMDITTSSVRETLEALQGVSGRPLVLREIPIRDGEGITGHVDLVSERAFNWNAHKPSDLIQLPDTVSEREQEARTELLETIADFDDDLLEQLLEDVTPSSDTVYDNLSNDLRQDLIVPVFFGSAENDNGIVRLLKVLRHETPGVDGVIERLGLSGAAQPVTAQVFKSVYAGHTGKLTYARILSGDVSDGMTLNGARVSGLYANLGAKQNKISKAPVGSVAAFGRMDEIMTGTVLSDSGTLKAENWPEPLRPLFSMAIHAAERADEVKLSGALHKLMEEDPSLSIESNHDTGEMLLWGQGEMHLLISLARLKSAYNMEISSHRPQVPYKETIRKPVSQHARHKKQSGGHGQFGDVHIDIKPMSRGAGFQFNDTITGGVVPKNYIPAVEHGVKDYLKRGPLGFPVVDVSVTLTDGQFHAVDSSDMAFKAAAQMAMREGMPSCNPVLLEPICLVQISVPNEFTSKIQRLVSGRRGQILGFDSKVGWKNWDEVSVQLPQSEMHGLIIDLRSSTQGVGSFEWSFDHLQEFTGKPADQVVAAKADTAH
jgi:elongation factor G